MKDLYELLEKLIDRCRDTGNLIAHIALKSTTHAVSTSIMGAGAARNPKTMRWHVVESIIWTWFMTLRATSLVAFGLMRLLQMCHVVPANCLRG